MKNTRLLTIVFLVGLVGVLYLLSRSLGQTECRVCMEFRGHRNCAVAAAPTEDQAWDSARRTACGPIASGVRDSFECDRTPPATKDCHSA